MIQLETVLPTSPVRRTPYSKRTAVMAKPLRLTTKGFLPGAAKPLFVSGPEDLGALSDFATGHVAIGDPSQNLVAGIPSDFSLFSASTGFKGACEPDLANDSIILKRTGLWLVFFQCSIDSSSNNVMFTFFAEADGVPQPGIRCQDEISAGRIDSVFMGGLVPVLKQPISLKARVVASKNTSLIAKEGQFLAARFG